MEKWKKVLPSVYNNLCYKTLLTMGEDEGLRIILNNPQNTINLFFGNIYALRFLDEGIVQKKLYDEVYMNDETIKSFDGVLYEIENGEFFNFMNNISFDMATTYNIKHYIIITQNYNIEILTQWKPDIEIKKFNSC